MHTRLLRQLPKGVADAPAAGRACDDWALGPLSALPDAALASAVAEAIAAPKRDADSSFLTHAPLELSARFQLLPMVAPKARDHVRRRMAAIAGDYARAGEEVGTIPAPFSDEAAAIQFVKRAIRGGDAEGADAALLFLVPRLSAAAISAALAGTVIEMLGAAAHAPILLADAPRLSWYEDAQTAEFPGDSEAELFNRLRAPPRVHSPSVYIAPTMLAVEADGYAAHCLADVTASLSVDAAARAILRSAAYSMLQDDPASAPYGWTHALTMPFGLFGCASMIADKRALVRVAATYALGFRATLGRVRLDPDPPARPRSPEIFNTDPHAAAGAVYHAEEARLPEIRTALATRAASHRDAHLAKYTLASFEAAARDPEAARLYLAAAAYLGAWWDAHPVEAFE